MRKNLLIFGCGFQAQVCQYQILNSLKKHGASFSVRLVVDLEIKRSEIQDFLQAQALRPQQCFFLPEEDRNSPVIHASLLTLLEKIKPEIDGVLICTEPKAHKKYIEWAVKNNIDVLVEKPITAPILNEKGPSQIWQDYLDIENWLKNSSAKVSLMTNKRLHKAFCYLYDLVKEVLLEHRMPITHIEISDGCGVWTFPQEYAYRENHPYKYGYGVLFHTGFHYLDLLTHFQELNHLLGLKEDSIAVNACGANPYDALHQMTADNYNRLFHTDRFTQEFEQLDWNAYKQYGMLDFISSFQFMKGDAVITQASLSMIQNSLSARVTPTPPFNQYHSIEGMKTLTHFAIFMGPLFYARLSYCLPTELTEDKPTIFFGVECYRNSRLIGGKPYQRQIFQDITNSDYLNHPVPLNYLAQEQVLIKWLNADAAQVDFSTYSRPVYLSSRVFAEIFRKRRSLT